MIYAIDFSVIDDDGAGESNTDLVFGSGYPGDPKCVERLGRNMHPVFGFPDIVRFSWSTTKTFLNVNHAYDVKWPCDQEEREGADISTMFSGNVETFCIIVILLLWVIFLLSYLYKFLVLYIIIVTCNCYLLFNDCFFFSQGISQKENASMSISSISFYGARSCVGLLFITNN